MPFNFTPQGLLAIQHLRYQRLWLAIGVLMVIGVVIGSVASIPSPIKSVMLQDKVLHTLVYACLMGWFAQIYRHDLTRLILFVSLVCLGIAMEFIQGMMPHRQFELLDMVANTSGVILAWALAYTRVGNVLERVEQCFCRMVLGT